MHAVTAFIYGFFAWLGYLAYVASTHGSALVAVALAPVIVSGVVAGLVLLEWLLGGTDSH